MNIPLLADKSCQIAKDYGVLIEEDGISYRYSDKVIKKQNTNTHKQANKQKQKKLSLGTSELFFKL